MQRRIYADYATSHDIQQGIIEGNIVRGYLHVNSKKLDDAFVRPLQPYITSSGYEDVEICHDDILVQGTNRRNRAIQGDFVAVKLLDGEETENSHDATTVKQVAESDAWGAPANSRCLGTIVHVDLTKRSRSMFACILRPHSSAPSSVDVSKGEVHLTVKWNRDPFLRAIPLDRRYPWILVSVAGVSATTDSQLKKLMSSNELPEYDVFIVNLDEWPVGLSIPRGHIVKAVGLIGNPQTEEEVALIETGLLNHRDEPNRSVLDEVEALVKTGISDADAREDFTDKNVFSIDPTTARDLDDAIHIEQVPSLGEKVFEIGVHIADVSHYVRRGSAVDDFAKDRTTTVYLPHQAYHMLPRELSESICSLSTKEKKATFSCVFRVNMEGNIVNEEATRFVPSIIQSRYQLSYDSVQDVLNSEHIASQRLPACRSDDPPIHLVPSIDTSDARTEITENRRYPLRKLYMDLVLLKDLTEKIRTNRFEAGSMSLKRVELRFATDLATSMPLDIKAERRLASHEIVEELMLITNRLVAKKLISSPICNAAVLRYHPPIKEKSLVKLTKMIESLRIGSFDLSTSKNIHCCLTTAYQKLGYRVGSAVEQAMIEGMVLAKYGVYGSETFEGPRHFALSFDCYTHFTSPIRRYPDILVHRLLKLALSLEKNDEQTSSLRFEAYCEEPTTKPLETLCELSNSKKEAAKKAQELAGVAWLLMFLLKFPADKLPRCCGTVLEVADKSLMVHIPEFNLKKRLEYLDSSSGLSRYLMKTRPEYRHLRLPAKYTRSPDGTECRIGWDSETCQTVGLYSAIPIYVLPSRDVPITFVMIPVCPTLPEYATTLKTERNS